MTTISSRVQFNVSAKDQSAAVFAQVRSSMTSLNRSANQLRGVFAGLVGGNMLAGFVRSMVSVNREVPAVKAALAGLTDSWQGFALKVGDSGLNSALINFSTRISGLLQGTNSLASSIGRLMGGAVNTMANVFEGVGRTIAFAYDNLEFFNRVAFAFIGIKIAQNVAWAGLGFLKFATSIRTVGLAMGLLNIMTSLSKKGILGLAAGGLALTYAFKDVKKYLDEIVAKMEDGLGPVFGLVRQGMEALGLNVNALKGDLSGVVIGLGAPGSQLNNVLGKAARATSGLNTEFKSLAETGSLTSSILSEVSQTISSAFGQAFNSVIEGTASVRKAFASMAKSILSNLANMAANKIFTSLFSSLLGGFGGGGTASAGMARFGGVFADGGTLGAGQWGIAGEAGPEVVRGPASIIPLTSRKGPSDGRSQVFNFNLNGSNNDATGMAMMRAEFHDFKMNMPKLIKATVSGERNLSPGFI